MSRSNVIAQADMQTESNQKLSAQEQQRLIYAIESAIEVGRQDQFHAWMRGPLHALLPHESLVCLELDKRGGACQVASLHHTLIDAVTMEFLAHAQHGLAVRLALAYRGNRRQTCTLDSTALKDVLPADSAPVEQSLVRNSVIHRIHLLSGATYCVVLFNVPEDRLDRCRRLFKLLSSHLKMALSRALATPARPNAAALTPRDHEILRLIAKGRSNREISVVLGISAITLKTQVARLYRKLDVQNRADAVARGLAAQSDT
ncbi:MAG: helix-turn-helix transcriptional regulator [Pseudomonadota bacterium]